MLRKKRFLIGGIIVFLSIGYLAYTGFASASTYYYEVSQYLELGSSVYGENVRVHGQVAPGSIVQEAQGRIVRFTMVDIEGGVSLPVVYQGVVPDTFKADSDVVVEGQLSPDGVFQAHTLMAKCPSKYERQESEA